MSENTKIQWAEHTGGPFLGCAPVSPGCGNCYAWELALTRLEPIFRKAYKAAGFTDWDTRPVWGDKATRVLSKGFWNDARRIEARHAKAGTRGRWFPSMIDWLDEMPAGIIDQAGNKLNPVAVLADFQNLIWHTGNLDWLLLTKRPENWASRIDAVCKLLACDESYRETPEARTYHEMLCPWRNGQPPENVWIGTSVEDQTRADERIPDLIEIPAKTHFLSCEPLLGDLDLSYWLDEPMTPQVQWVIVGGESGPKARPCNIDWIRSIVQQCKAAGVPVFVKQLGKVPIIHDFRGDVAVYLKDPKGGDPSEWPEDLRVREFPL